jgi:hypothetical protein
MLGQIESLLNLPALKTVLEGVSELPQQAPGSAIELKAAHLPRP